MATFVALYEKPDDVEAWEEYYRTTHMPLVEQWPNVQSTKVIRFSGTPRGTDAPFHVMAIVEWATDEEMAAALRSEQGMAAAKDAMAMAQQFGTTPAMMLGGPFS